MIQFHYCKNYKENTNPEINSAVRKVLNSYVNRDRLKGSGKLMSFTKKIFVLRLKTPFVEVILEEKDIIEKDKTFVVYFVRGFKNGLQDYVEIRDGKWLRHNKLPDFEINEFLLENSPKIKQKENRNPPPQELLNWQNDYKLKVKYNIFESESWVKFAMNDSKEEGMTTQDSRLYLLALKKITSNIVRPIENNYETKTIVMEDIAIIYTHIFIHNKVYYLLHNGANTTTQQNHWEKVRTFKLQNNQQFNSFHDISKLAAKAYPDWTLNDPNLWIKIEKNNEIGNLSLLPEQTNFLGDFKFPKYINGQAGSGKSTMLYYLFANAYYYKCADEIKGNIIFLTENEKLLEHTKHSVYDLLLHNPDFDLSSEHIAIANADKYFFSFKKFLLGILPSDQILFTPDKYLDFSKFKKLYQKSTIQDHIKQKYSAELVWFTLSTYVFGYSLKYKIDSDNYEQKMPKEGKELITIDDLKSIEQFIIKPFYNKLINEKSYWDKIKLITYINENIPLIEDYEVIFCDEAQDFSRVELEFILKLSTYTKYDLSNVPQFPIIFAGDALQTVNPTGFKSEALTAMIYKELTSEKIGFQFDQNSLVFTPTFNYRSSQSIVNIANAIQNYRKENFSVNIQNPQTSKRPVFYENEHLNVFVDFDLFCNDQILQEKIEFKTIIVPVNNDEINSYKDKHPILENFNNIISPMEAKGLDFNEVVIYGFGNYIEKKKFGIYEKRYFYNKLYVAVTRAQAELVIIDSPSSKTSFWEPLIKGYLKSDWAKQMQPPLMDLDKLLIFDSGEVIQSSEDIVEFDAFRQKEQGVLERNIPLLSVASSHFIKLGNKKEYYICLALIEEINENWLTAANFYSKKEVGTEGTNLALNSLWEGKIWSEFIKKTDNKVNTDSNLMIIIAESFISKELSDNNLKLIFDHQNQFIKLFNRTSWSDDILQLFIVLLENSFDKDRINKIAEIITENVSNSEKLTIQKVGDKFYDNQQYQQAISTFENANIECENYFKSKLEIAKKRQQFDEAIIYSGRILLDTKCNKKKLATEIIEIYNDNQFSKKQHPNIYIDLYFYLALICINDYKHAIEISVKIENSFTNLSRQLELADHYNFILNEFNNTGNELLNFILERWLINGYNGGMTIEDINIEYANIAYKRDFKQIPYELGEIQNISNIPNLDSNIESGHITDIEIQNFKKFKSLKVKDIGLINLIVGDNNVGKTSFLESLLFTTNKQEYLKRLAFAHIHRINIKPEKQENSEVISWFYNLDSKFLNEYETSGENFMNINYKIYNKRTYKKYNVIFDKNQHATLDNDIMHFRIDDFSLLQHIPYQDSVKTPLINYGEGFGPELANVYEKEIRIDRGLENEFLKNLNLFIPNLESIFVRLDGSIDIREKNSFKDKPLHQYGDGANKLFRILLLLTLHKGKRVLIDEIDAGIHYSRFKEFWEILVKIASTSKTQLFATTHNDECIKFFTEVITEAIEQLNIKKSSRVIQMKSINGIKVNSFRFESFNLAYEDGIELRGGADNE